MWGAVGVAQHPILNNIIIEKQDDFATYIRYRYSMKNFCDKCNKPFASASELKDHKRLFHSY